MTPTEIMDAKPHLKDIWTDEPHRQYGRPIAFYQQLQEQDVQGAFEKLNVPTLVIWGEYDWIMAREDSEWIVNAINKHRKGLPTLAVVSRMNHSQGLYSNPIDAFNETNLNGVAQVDSIILNWLSTQK